MIQFLPFAAVGGVLLVLRLAQGIGGRTRGTSSGAGPTGEPLYVGAGASSGFAVTSAVAAMIAANSAVGGTPTPATTGGTAPGAVAPPAPPPHVQPAPSVTPAPSAIDGHPVVQFVPASQMQYHPDYRTGWAPSPSLPQNPTSELVRSPEELQQAATGSNGINDRRSNERVTPTVYPAGFTPPDLARGQLEPSGLPAPGHSSDHGSTGPRYVGPPTPAPAPHPAPVRFLGGAVQRH